MSIQSQAEINQLNSAFRSVKEKSDRVMNYFLPAFFIAGLVIAFYYDTFLVGFTVGGLSLIAYYSTKWALPKSDLYQYVLSAVLGIFMAQYIYQMHGLFEMHFIAFIGSAMLITYQNWKLQLPLTVVVIVHHALFGYLQYKGIEHVYFTQLDYMTLQTFIIHAILAVFIFFISGLWAYNMKNYTKTQIEQSFEIFRLQEVKGQQEMLKALNETLEQKVAERTQELEATNKELEGFNYSVSHDLRAPLRIIQGFGKMLLKTADGKLDKDEKENLHSMIANARQMGSLIDNLLDFSRLGKTAIAKNPVNMTDIVGNVVKEIKSSTPNSKAEINIQNMFQANCDPVLIKQVWVNLVSNAFKYSRNKEKPLIEIGAQKQDGSQVFYIKDNGAGFDMEHSEKLFGVFQRLHKVAEYEGTGVGLALVHRIITKHGGKIWADAKLNEGATFYFTLS